MNNTGLFINEANARVLAAVKNSINAGREHGMQVCAHLGGKCVIDVAVGSKNPATGEKVDGDTLFKISRPALVGLAPSAPVAQLPAQSTNLRFGFLSGLLFTAVHGRPTITPW